MTFATSSTDLLDRGSNALDIARDAFTLLVTGPKPLAVDGRDFAGLPDRVIPLNELRDLLLDGCTRMTRDQVWVHLVEQARRAGSAWTVGCVGMAMPALLAVANRLCDRLTEDRDDVCAAVLAGFLERLSTVDLARPGVVVRLRWAALRAGCAARREALPGVVRPSPGFSSEAPPLPWQHEDLVLLCAVADDVLTPAETDLIGDTRLDRVRIEVWAGARNLRRDAVYKARARAEQRLRAYLNDQRLDAGEEHGFAAAGAFPLYHATVPTHGGQSGADARQLAVSGRRRNGRPAKSTGLVSKTRAEVGLHRRGHTAPMANGPLDDRPCR
jgi:hypothetical protein